MIKKLFVITILLTDKELLDALKGLPNNKSPGNEGVNKGII